MKIEKKGWGWNAVLFLVLAVFAIFIALYFLTDIQKQLNETKTETACKNKGGLWGVSPDGEKFCNLKTSDGGKECYDSSECETYCKAPENSTVGESTTGTCYSYQTAICMKEIIEGRVKEEWCV